MTITPEPVTGHFIQCAAKYINRETRKLERKRGQVVTADEQWKMIHTAWPNLSEPEQELIFQQTK